MPLTTSTTTGASSAASEPRSAPHLWWPGLLLAVATFVASTVRASDAGEGGAEVRHLALIGLLALTALLPTLFERQKGFASGICVLYALVVFALPDGPLRAGSAGLILAVAWLLGATSLGQNALRLPTRGLPTWELDFRTMELVGLALGLQALARGRVLVTEPSVKAAFILLVLPTVAGLATAQLHRRHGQAGLCAAATLVVVAGSISTAAALTLGALAAASLESRKIAYPLSAGLVLITLAWSLPIGALTGLGVLYFFGLPRWPAGLMVTAGLLLALAPVRNWDLPLEMGALLLAGLFVAVGTGQERTPAWSVAAAFGLALAGLRFLEPREALLAPALILALGTGRYLSDRWLRSQLAWCATLIATGALLANYPWHRDVDLVSLLSRESPWFLPLALVVGISAALNLRHHGTLRAALLATSVVGLAAVPLLRPRTVLLEWPPTTLRTEQPVWEVPLEADGADVTIFVDSMLSNAADLTPGVAAATVELLDQSGERVVAWPIRTGLESGEWAADRTGSPRPEPINSKIDASGDFFGHSYRARFHAALDPPSEAPLRLRVTLDEGAGEASLQLVHVAAQTRRLSLGRSEDTR